VARDNHDLGRSHAVYLTTDLDLAWGYAASAKGRGKPRVLVVSPLDQDLQLDDSTVNGDEQPAYTCGSAVVIDVLTEAQQCPLDGCCHADVLLELADVKSGP
jgi:hypothetical protein